MSGALQGLHVLDLTRHRAGPTCTRMLADLGADVVKIEGPKEEDGGLNRRTADYQNLNANKRSACVDLSTSAGRDVFLRLARRADCVVESFRPTVKRRLGIDYAVLAEANPRIVLASLSGFGQHGPYRDRPGLDQVAQGIGGFMSLTGHPEHGPVRAGVPIADLTAGMFLAYGIAVALYERERSGQGQQVDTSLLEAMCRLLDLQALRFLNDGDVPRQAGNGHPVSAPVGAFQAADGLVNVQAGTDSLFARLCTALGRNDLPLDARFATETARREHRSELDDWLQHTIATERVAHWVTVLNDAGVPTGPVLDVQQAFDDPQVAALETTAGVEHPDLGPFTLLRSAVNLRRTPAALRNAVPARGADTVDVLRESGYQPGEIARLVDQHVVTASHEGVGA